MLLVLVALMLLGVAGGLFVQILEGVRPAALVFGSLALACFIFSVWGAVKAVPLLASPGLVTPTQLIQMGSKHGRIYAWAGYASYVQILLIDLAVFL